MGFDIAALNIIDFVAIIVLVISGGLATLRGMTREIMGLAGWPISFVAARLTSPYIEPILTETIRVEGISQALAWGIPFIIVVVLWFAFSSLVSPGLSKAGLGGLDRWLGFFFGVIRGFVIVLVIYVGAVVAAEGEDKLPSLVTDAQITPLLRESAHLTSGLLSDEMRARVIDSLPDPAPVIEELQEAGQAVGDSLEKTDSSGNPDSGGGLELLSDEGGN